MMPNSAARSMYGSPRPSRPPFGRVWPLAQRSNRLGSIERFRPVLAQTPLLRVAPTAALDDLFARCELRTARKKGVLVSLGELVDSIYLIAAGRVRVQRSANNGREMTVGEYGLGEFFGESVLQAAGPSKETVLATEDVTVLRIRRDELLSHLQMFPSTGVSLTAELVRRLDRQNDTAADLALYEVEERLLRLIGRLAARDGERVSDGVVIRRMPTQQVLANQVGSCRETVSRTITALEKRGLIHTNGRMLILKT